MKLILKGFIFLALTPFFSMSHAAVFTYEDYLWDDSNNFVTNTVSNTEWFRWNTKDITGHSEWNRLFTSGSYSLSANHILDKVNDGGASGSQWRFANADDMLELFTDFFGSFALGANQTVDSTAAQNFISLMGQNYIWQTLFQNNSTNLNAAGFVFSLSQNHLASLSPYNFPQTLDNPFSFTQTSQYRIALVRTTSVNEPTTLALLALGLFGLGAARCKPTLLFA